MTVVMPKKSTKAQVKKVLKTKKGQLLFLNLGCGDVILPSDERFKWLNVDVVDQGADIISDARDLSAFPDESVDGIYACHLIEHFGFHEAFVVLAEWMRILKVGGQLTVEAPDFLASCHYFIDLPVERHPEMYSHFFGGTEHEFNMHKFNYTKPQLHWTLEKAGFVNIVELPALRYVGRENICQKWMCNKRG